MATKKGLSFFYRKNKFTKDVQKKMSRELGDGSTFKGTGYQT